MKITKVAEVFLGEDGMEYHRTLYDGWFTKQVRFEKPNFQAELEAAYQRLKAKEEETTDD